jgi:hypothetical protein
MDLKEIGGTLPINFLWLRIGTYGNSCEYGNESYGSIKDGKFLD